jgi:anti-sigma regulatory factor (Ser/Thr protein kinase)
MRQARRFPCQPESVPGARHFVRDALRAQPREIVEAAELMTSELATNSVRHAHSDFELAILLSRQEIRVEVTDHGQGQPVPRSPTTQEQSGRGLQIVLELSDAWGVDPSANGKLVWFALQLHSRAGEPQSHSTVSSGRVPEQLHDLEQNHQADLGSCHSRIGRLRWSHWTLKAYAGSCGQPEVAISVQPAERRCGLARESARF